MASQKSSGTKRLAKSERPEPSPKRSTQKLTKKDSKSNCSYFFHYTNKKGRDAIKKDGFIKASGDLGMDATFGEGVYLTSRSPLDGKLALAKNNWEQKSTQRLDYVIVIFMPVDDVQRAQTKRDVYLYKGDLVLKKYDHKILTWNMAVKRCKEPGLKLWLGGQKDEESYGDDVDVWMPDIFLH